jgi:hypothetical protein
MTAVVILLTVCLTLSNLGLIALMALKMNEMLIALAVMNTAVKAIQRDVAVIKRTYQKETAKWSPLAEALERTGA